MIRILPLLCLIVVITGCASAPIREIDYNGELPASTQIDYTFAVQFANDLAAETEMKISYIEKPNGQTRHDGNIHILFAGPDRITAGITADKPTHTIYITIDGNIDSPFAKPIAEKVVQLFQKKFPDGKITPFTRYPTILGP